MFNKLCYKCNQMATVTVRHKDYCSLHGLEASMTDTDKGKEIIRKEERAVKGVTKPN